MEFSLLHDGYSTTIEAGAQRFHEMVTEAIFAEEMGFDAYGVAEQHFLPSGACCSAPEMLLTAVGARTTRLKLRVTSAILLTYNHPIRVAERLTTMDVLTNGRAELSTGRSNNISDLEAFQVDPKDTRAQWAEALEIIAKALTQDPFEHEGRFWRIPPRTLSPKAIQKPHPPLYVAATSIGTARIAGEKGIGLISGNSLPGGWDGVQETVEMYEEAVALATPVTGHVHDWVAIAVVTAHCAPTKDVARREAESAAYEFVDLAIHLFDTVAPTAPEYAYMSSIDKIRERRRDLDFLIDRAPYISIGTPDFLIERFKRLEAMGVDEVLLRIDAMGHETNMRSIEMFGKHVLPEFRQDTPAAVAEPVTNRGVTRDSGG